MSKEFQDTFRHFDNLIWQVPNWSTAIFLGILTSIWLIGDPQENPEFHLFEKRETIKMVLGMGAFVLFTQSYALFRFRYHQRTEAGYQTHEKSKTLKFIGRYFGAQVFLQLSVNIELAIILGLFINTLWNKRIISIIVFICTVLVCSIFTESIIQKRTKINT